MGKNEVSAYNKNESVRADLKCAETLAPSVFLTKLKKTKR